MHKPLQIVEHPRQTTQPLMTRRLPALVAALALVVGVAVGLSAPAGATAPSGDASHLYVLTNQSRSAHGKAWLGWDQNLAGTAQAHANWMAATGSFAHDVNLQAHAGAAVPGMNSWGENIAYVTSGPGAIATMHNNYLGSPGHLGNILGGQYDRVGIGIAYGGGRTYSVVRFASSPNKSALGQAVGSFDSATSPAVNKLKVTGWAIDPDSTGAVVVDIRVDGALVSSVTANASRPDVGNSRKGFGDHHGLDVTVTAAGGATRSVCLAARNLAGHGSTVNLGCRNVLIKGNGPFWDLTLSHPFAADIAWLKSSGITSGFADGTFRPNDDVSREALAAFLWRYAGQPAPAAGAPNFTDVPAAHPFRTAIRWMAGEGYATGYGDGTFRGNSPVTRQAVASFLWKFQGRPPVPVGSPSFRDVPSGHPFRDAVRWMAGTRITTGYADNTFHPAENLSRQAMAAFLHRLDQL